MYNYFVLFRWQENMSLDEWSQFLTLFGGLAYMHTCKYKRKHRWWIRRYGIHVHTIENRFIDFLRSRFTFTFGGVITCVRTRHPSAPAHGVFTCVRVLNPSNMLNVELLFVCLCFCIIAFTVNC